ncbi:site-specific integrase [Lentzea sp. NPDC005914]|uniref:site-specific integrase n=1 Tax=Lentzea sp. NPDC005914 TaxID=3154572 RepID=UPI0033E3E2D0
MPKRNKERQAPVSSGVLEQIDDHLELFEVVPVALPWDQPNGQPVTVNLLITKEDDKPYSGDLFNKVVWTPAFKRAGLTYTNRQDGMHAMRHLYASILLARGESVKELAEFLGHEDPGFTLRTYTHLMPSSHRRAWLAVDGVFKPNGVRRSRAG